jgi:hypothetical protein
MYYSRHGVILIVLRRKSNITLEYCTMCEKKNNITLAQAGYYKELLDTFGISDVRSVASGDSVFKMVRYEGLSQLFARDKEFCLHDVGFGLGHFYEYVRQTFPDKKINYSGSEITREFFEFCNKKYPETSFFLRDLSIAPPEESYDYFILGGTFYHTVGVDPDNFEAWVKTILLNCFQKCKKGISFNLVSSFVEYEKDDLFYFQMDRLLDFVVNHLSRFFMINHAVPLFECTVCVYKPEYVSTLYSADEFKKYFSIRSP